MAGKLFLGGISPNTTTEAIEAHFAKYGQVVDAVVMYKDGKHRGFGFVTFDNPGCVNAVLAEEQVIDGRTVDAKPAVPQGEAPPPRSSNGADNLHLHHAGLQAFGGPCVRGPLPRPVYSALPRAPPAAVPVSGSTCDKVFVGGLAQTTTDDMVRQYFSQYGSIIDCVVMKDRGSMRSRGFGFVQFDRPEPVDQIIADYASHHVDGKWIEVKKAIPQDQMPSAIATGSPPPSRSGSYGGYSVYGFRGSQPLWPGRSAYAGPPAAYSPSSPHYGIGTYGHYPVYPSFQPAGGAYLGSRSAYRQRPY
mmetsp:Transcript_50220/g.116594  ORF Transcript_50220/g.116594 Transcript_50220/m.116594 type:complete len:304 (-) Transcript_50220:203-1114(-)